MVTIQLPPDLETRLSRIAAGRSVSIEDVVLEQLVAAFGVSPSSVRNGRPRSLADRLERYVGTVDGPSEALSENCGERFERGLREESAKAIP